MMRAWQGAVGVSRIDGLVSPAYVVYVGLTIERDDASRYFDYLFRTPALQRQMTVVDGHRSIATASFTAEHFKQIRLAVPTTRRTAAIVRFLDHADRRIRRYIRAKQKLIALLNEQKQAIIHRAVTRGLDPNVRTQAVGRGVARGRAGALGRRRPLASS